MKQLNKIKNRYKQKWTGINSLNSLVPVYLFIGTTFRWQKNYLLSFVSNHLIFYGTPINLSYAWSFGSLAGVSLVIQIVSGIFLAMYYVPHTDYAFDSVQFIMREVNNGWLIRYIHSNGASMFFIVVYCHIFRGLYYGSYIRPRELLWISGVILLILMMATAFLGYVLPWGQMSFWGATVITSMVTIIPNNIGKHIVEWLWGGFTVGNPTLQRFYSLHFFLPFVMVGVTLIHLILLHKDGSSAPVTDSTGVDLIPFYPYYFLKDLFAFQCYLLVFSILVYHCPDLLSDPNNYIPADPMHTPLHIVPEWYFLPFYAMLRSIPHKTLGILTMFASILILFIIPFLNTSTVRDTSIRPLFKFCYWAAVTDFIILGYIGQSPINEATIFVGQIATIYYFFFFIVLIPLTGLFESYIFARNQRFKKKERRQKNNSIVVKVFKRRFTSSSKNEDEEEYLRDYNSCPCCPRCPCCTTCTHPNRPEPRIPCSPNCSDIIKRREDEQRELNELCEHRKWWKDFWEKDWDADWADWDADWKRKVEKYLKDLERRWERRWQKRWERRWKENWKKDWDADWEADMEADRQKRWDADWEENRKKRWEADWEENRKKRWEADWEENRKKRLEEDMEEDMEEEPDK